MDFGFEHSASNNTGIGEEQTIETSNIPADSGSSNESVEDITEENPDDASTNDDVNNDNNSSDDDLGNSLSPNDIVEFNGVEYKVDDKGNIVDANGVIFKEAKDVDTWLKDVKESGEFDDGNDIISAIQKHVGFTIVDENDNPVSFDSSPEGIANFVKTAIDNSKEEHYEQAINSLYSKFPFVQEIIDYYLANGNSLDGYTQGRDLTNVIVEDDNEQQQIAIIKTAWAEQQRRGDVDGYIDYLKTAGLLASTAKEELEGLKQYDAVKRQQMNEAAQQAEEEQIAQLQQYWGSVKQVVDSRQISGYQIPENIIINRDGKRFSATPDDFFNYIYLVDENGQSAYQRDLLNDSIENRRDDEILRAYLKFTGGSYSSLVDMAINKKEVNRLVIKSSQSRKHSNKAARVTKTSNTNKPIDFGF